MSASDDEEYIVPLQDQRVFGAGIKRKRVQFVPSSESASSSNTAAQQSGPSASDFYLNLVLGKKSDERQTPATNYESSPLPEQSVDEPEQRVTLLYSPQARLICETCCLPIDTKEDSVTPHAALLAHQLSLPHSHPPSSLSRSHPGLKILQSQGWDPDARAGLGARGEGIRFPLKAKEKGDKMGIGAEIPKPKKGDREVSRAVEEARVKKRREEERGKKGKGWLKKQVAEEKRRGDKLKDLFYASESVDKYLRNEQ